MQEQNFSIDLLSEKIDNSKTKSYFKEVLQTYYSKAYRSCLVTLYSVVICDLIFKLEELKEIHSDEKAGVILDDIISFQDKSPRNPDWENKLIDDVSNKTAILEAFEIEHIIQLKNQRNLSAHPILTAESILFTPNKETVTAFVINMLNYVLTKPPFLSNKITDRIIIDISENKDRIFVGDTLEKYLEAKYFKRTNENFINLLFKKLWKYIFILDNDDCIENREINFLALKYIYKRNKLSIEKSISENKEYYSFSKELKIADVLNKFLFHHPDVYIHLSDTVKIEIDALETEVPRFGLLLWYKDLDINLHLDKIKAIFEKNHVVPSKATFERLLDLADQFDRKSLLLDLGISIFRESRNFDAADIHYGRFIYPYLDNFDFYQLESIIEAIDSNRQIYSRRAARTDHRVVRDLILEKKPSFRIKDYKKFVASCG